MDDAAAAEKAKAAQNAVAMQAERAFYDKARILFSYGVLLIRSSELSRLSRPVCVHALWRWQQAMLRDRLVQLHEMQALVNRIPLEVQQVGQSVRS